MDKPLLDSAKALIETAASNLQAVASQGAAPLLSAAVTRLREAYRIVDQVSKSAAFSAPAAGSRSPARSGP